MDRNSNQPWSFVGCLLIFPAGGVGTSMILDYPGPPGPLGFAEYFGWWTICLGAAFVTAKMLGKAFEERRYRYGRVLLAICTPLIITAALWWDVQPTTPATVKNVVEYGQQAIGVTAIAGVLGWLFRTRRVSKPSDDGLTPR